MFEAGQLPAVKGFWSLTLYDEHHLFALLESNPRAVFAAAQGA